LRLLLGYIQLITSLLSIFYTTAQFPQQVRLQKPEDTQIRTFSVTTVALIVWRSLIVGSRILAFVLFASLFRHWLFVVIGFHYLLMFALVFYQMRLAKQKLITRVVYNVVTPFVYIFDFCVNWLEGPTRYWYIMVYAPMYCENLLMGLLGLLYACEKAWYVVPGCVCVVVMFPLGLLVQAAYYLYLHPKAATRINSDKEHAQTERSTASESPAQRSTRLSPRFMSWPEFQNEVFTANHPRSRPTGETLQLKTKALYNFK